MYERIIVPTKATDDTWRAVEIGVELSAKCGAELEIVSVVDDETDIELRRDVIEARLVPQHVPTPSVTVSVDVIDRSIAATIAGRRVDTGRSLVVMATAAHGRSEAILGSVAEELLTETGGPLIAVGPHVDTDAFDASGPIVVALDGSTRAETALGPAADHAEHLGVPVWLTTMLEPAIELPPDINETGYLDRLADSMRSGRNLDVEYEILHGDHAARPVIELASMLGASLIVASTHGRTGLARLALGSVAMEIVHRAECPVLLVRPDVSLLEEHVEAGAQRAHS